MILTEEELSKQYGAPKPPSLEPELDSSTFSETLGAAFRQENVIGSLASNLPYVEKFSAVSQVIDRDFDVLGEIEARNYEPYAESFNDVYNREQFEARAQKIDAQLQDREMLQNSGAKGIASQIIAGAFDPINFVPVGGQVYKGARTSNTILQASMNTARIAAPSIALQEGLLNATQETRTLGESVVNVTAGTFLAGVLGGAGKFVSDTMANPKTKGIISKMEKDLVDDNQNLVDAEKNLYGNLSSDDSLSAARAFETTLEQETLAKGLGTAEVTRGLNPTLRLAHSPIKEVREFSQQLIDTPLMFNKNFDGIASPASVENLRFEQDVRSADIVQTFERNFKAHKKAASQAGNTYLRKPEFNKAVAFAMRNGDVGVDEHVTAVASSLRKSVIEPLKERAVKLGLLPDDVDVTTASSYLTRMHSKEKILANPDGFRKIVREWSEDQIKIVRRAKQADFNNKINSVKSKLAKATKGTDEFSKLKVKLEDLEMEKNRELGLINDPDYIDDYLDNIVDDLFNKLTGVDRQPLSFEVTLSEVGALKGRTWSIEDNKIQEFLENDAEFVLDYYNRQMTGQLLLQEKYGTLNFDEAKKGLIEAKNAFVKGLPEKEQAKVERDFSRNLDDLSMLWDITKGTYKSAHNPDSLFVQGGRFARDLNYMRLMGGVLISSFPDVANLVLSNGFKNVFGDLLIPVFKNIRKLKPVVSELKEAGIVLESVLNSRVQTLMELGDPTARGTLMTRTASNMTTIFSKATGITYWNDFMKSGAGILTQNRILKNAHNVASGKGLSKKEKAFSAWVGLDSNDLKQIAKLQKQYGKNQDGILLSGSSMWENQAIARKFKAALNKDVNSTIVTKGIGDVPAFSNSEIGKTLLQFQTFSMAANQRITIKAAQRLAAGDTAVAEGITALISMGMLVAYLKSEGHRSGSTDNWEMDKWLIEGIDRSGIIPIMMMFNNPWERVGLPGLGAGVSAITGNEAQPVSRYAARGTAESLLGPTFGTIADTLTAIHSVTSGELTDKDIHRLRKLMPFQNLIGLREIIDQIDPETR